MTVCFMASCSDSNGDSTPESPNDETKTLVYAFEMNAALLEAAEAEVTYTDAAGKDVVLKVTTTEPFTVEFKNLKSPITASIEAKFISKGEFVPSGSFKGGYFMQFVIKDSKNTIKSQTDDQLLNSISESKVLEWFEKVLYGKVHKLSDTLN